MFKARARLAALQGFTRLLLLRRERMHGAGGCLIRTTYYHDRLRRRLAERLSQRGYVFTLQTQSLFDGSLPGVPHFVYTDHAELQCLDLPGFSPKQLFPPRWIAPRDVDLRERRGGLHDERRDPLLSRPQVRHPHGPGGMGASRAERAA